ncbi:MAG: alpha-galactosidase [Chloroflexota bacterium]|nr:alpha-galactosidase [Chloroflexota bacterium]
MQNLRKHQTVSALITGLFVANFLLGLFPFEQLVLADRLQQHRIEEPKDLSVIVLSNGIITRVVQLSRTGPVTISLMNLLTGTEYLKATRSEFRLLLSHELTGNDQIVELPAEAFHMTSYSWNWQSRPQQLQVELSGTFAKVPVQATLYYEVQEGTNFIRKWLKVAPFNAPGWVIREVVLEDWQAKEELEPLGIVQRYPELHADGSDQINYSSGRDPNALDTSNPSQRFSLVPSSHEVAQHRDGKQGLYFFTESLFGKEQFDGNLKLSNADFIEPKEGFSSGRAVIGTWQGSSEIGFKRYNDYIYNHYAVIKGKKDPVWLSTWYVYEDKINEAELTQMVNNMQEAGFYDVLHIDAGWEKDAPLQVNTAEDKFPEGLDLLAGKLNSAGLGMGLWMNPFSGHYQDITSYQSFREQHPDWIASNGTWICPLSGAGEYIRNRLLEIIQSWPLKELYWDGADWNLAGCDSKERGWRTPAEEHILTLKFFANLLQELHSFQSDLRVVVWSAPPDIHWLSVTDQVQLSDIDTPPLGLSELIRRQQIYHASFQRPAAAIWGDWYGLQYRRSWSESLGLPLNRLQYAEMSQLGNGATQAGGSYALPYAHIELTAFLAKMFAFRKQFGSYFNYYQHILNFPDGSSVEGEAHLIDGKGFILLYNPQEIEQTINLPLNEPELELSPEKSYSLTDWSTLDTSQTIGDVYLNQSLPISVPALGWRIIGLNIPNETPASLENK